MIRPPTNYETQMDGEDRAAIVYRVHQRLLQEVDLSSLEKRSPEEARVAIEASVRSIVADVAGVADMAGLYGDAKEAVIKAVVDEAVGFGPIQPLVDDPTISEVMVNAPGEVYFERDGVIHAAEARFNDEAHILRIVERIIAPLGRRVDESSPYVDARLPDGSRVNVMIPPLIPRSPTITIRKFRPERHTIEDLVQNETFSQEAVEFIGARIEQRKNIVISGGTGTGKTTVLNALSAFIPEAERIITIEDPIELKLQQRHVVAMEARPANIEGRNAVSQRELVRNALRMRPDRIIVGEVRGQEAFDMMQAMNTGHEGSMTTVHANSARDALSRIENMVLMAGLDLPLRAIREQMASALHLLVHLSRSSDGRRVVTSISETGGLKDDTVALRELFKLDAAGRLEPVSDGAPR
ncbi:MAG: CpaF family protein [Chloroflexi bacterium]|nr:CpaF family protein [Chloroflexota bacterium]